MSVLNTAPSFLLLGRGKSPARVTWTREDRILFQAVTELQDEKCPHCGTPMWLSHTAHSAVEFEHRWRVCYLCQERDELEKDAKDKKPGEYVVSDVRLADGFERLPTRAEGYAALAEPLHATGAPESSGLRSVVQ